MTVGQKKDAIKKLAKQFHTANACNQDAPLKK